MHREFEFYIFETVFYFAVVFRVDSLLLLQVHFAAWQFITFISPWHLQNRKLYVTWNGITRRLWRRCTGTQQRVLQYWGRSNTHQHWFAIGLQLGQKFFNVAFCSYLHLQYFNWAAVPGRRFSNPPTSQSPIVGRNMRHS